MDSVTDSIDFFYINGSLPVHEPYPAIFQRDKMLLIAVSYTHLDVYKRQGYLCPV